MTTFYKWMMKFTKQNSPRGDLARDMKDDITWPSSNDLAEMANYLEYQMNADKAVMEVFKMCYEQYNTQQDRVLGGET